MSSPPASLELDVPDYRSVSPSAESTASSMLAPPMLGSTGRRSSGVDVKTKKRGYLRPVGTEFSRSARNRDSVMALGSISHLQYFFAKTRLLDGKGGGLKSKKSTSEQDPLEASLAALNGLHPPIDSAYSSSISATSSPEPPFLHPDYQSMSPTALSDAGDIDDHAFDSDSGDEIDENVLPPTVSTYKGTDWSKKQIPKAPNPDELRSSLRQALNMVKEAWVSSSLVETPEEAAYRRESGASSILSDQDTSLRESIGSTSTAMTTPRESLDSNFQAAPTGRPSLPRLPSDIEGTHLIDVTTSAIRAAKEYHYSSSSSSASLTAPQSKTLREDFIVVLDNLKRLASRQFDPPITPEERDTVVLWVTKVDSYIQAEEKAIAELRMGGRRWLDRSLWNRKDPQSLWKRNHLFMTYFDTSGEALPEPSATITTPAEDTGKSIPSSFILALASGTHLVKIHNALVARSKRPFGEIKTWHEDTTKPYRCADNLRYWRKAGELRWEVASFRKPTSWGAKNEDVMNIVNSYLSVGEGAADAGVWEHFANAVNEWCERVLEEMRADWKDSSVSSVKKSASVGSLDSVEEAGDE